MGTASSFDETDTVLTKVALPKKGLHGRQSLRLQIGL